MEQQENRKYRRHEIQRKAILMTDGHSIRHLKTRDISVRGITLVSDAVLPQARYYKVSLALAENPLDLEKGRYIEFTAQLVNTGTVELQNRFRYGFMIVNIEPRFERLLIGCLDCNDAFACDPSGPGCDWMLKRLDAENCMAKVAV